MILLEQSSTRTFLPNVALLTMVHSQEVAKFQNFDDASEDFQTCRVSSVVWRSTRRKWDVTGETHSDRQLVTITPADDIRSRCPVSDAQRARRRVRKRGLFRGRIAMSAEQSVDEIGLVCLGCTKIIFWC